MPRQASTTPWYIEYLSTICDHNQRIIEHFIRSKQLEGVSPKTIVTEMYAVKNINTYFRDAPLDQLTTEQVEDWYLWFRNTPTARTGKVPSPATLQNNIMELRAFFSDIHDEEVVAKMFKRIRVPRHNKVTVKEEELMTDDEIRRMIHACADERDRAIIAVLYSSGCRVGELCNLRLKDVTLRRESASLHLNGKTGERDIDLFVGVPELKQWLAVHPYRDNSDAPLFPQKFGRGTYTQPRVISPQAIWAMLDRIAEKAGIPEKKRANPHAFRHKRATDLADHMTTADLRYMFGWTDMSSTPNIYVHSSRGKVRRKLAEIAGVRVPESVAPTTMVRQCPVCGAINAANATWCINCTATLDEHLARTEQQTEEFMLQKIREGAQRKQE